MLMEMKISVRFKIICVCLHVEDAEKKIDRFFISNESIFFAYFSVWKGSVINDQQNFRQSWSVGLFFMRNCLS